MIRGVVATIARIIRISKRIIAVMNLVFEMSGAADDQRFFIFERIPNLFAMTARSFSEIRRIIAMSKTIFTMMDWDVR